MGVEHPGTHAPSRLAAGHGLTWLVGALAVLVVSLNVHRQTAAASGTAHRPSRGVLAVTISGLPASTSARLVVSGRGQRSGTRILVASGSLSLPPGRYTVGASAVGSPVGSYRPAIARQTVQVLPGRIRRLVVTYALAAKVPPVPTGPPPASSTPTAPIPEPDPVVSITFDDGLRSQYANAIPLLDRYGFKSTHYISTAGIGDGKRVTVDMIRSMFAGGHLIASHTVTHPHLTTLSPASVESELTESRRTLEAVIGAPVVDFASPYGDYDANVLAAIGTVYRTHRTASAGYNTMRPFNRYYIRTQTVQTTTTTADVKLWIETAQQSHRWLVIVYHQVEETPTSIYGTTPTNLDAQLAAIRDSGLRVATVDTVVSEIDARNAAAPLG